MVDVDSGVSRLYRSSFSRKVEDVIRFLECKGIHAPEIAKIAEKFGTREMDLDEDAEGPVALICYIVSF